MPKRLHILYTEEEGGDFKYISFNNNEKTRQFFLDTIKTGILNHRTGDRIIRIHPAYIVLAEDSEDYDFILKRSRMKKETDEKS
jgi:acetylornithine/succinyldiaminopimelate/putrescine aminotransferase